jgi:hypothetical protein
MASTDLASPFASATQNPGPNFAIAAIARSTIREKNNAYIHMAYIRKDYNECLRLIEEQLRACNGQAEYPLYVKGKRQFS